MSRKLRVDKERALGPGCLGTHLFSSAPTPPPAPAPCIYFQVTSFLCVGSIHSLAVDRSLQSISSRDQRLRAVHCPGLSSLHTACLHGPDEGGLLYSMKAFAPSCEEGQHGDLPVPRQGGVP